MLRGVGVLLRMLMVMVLVGILGASDYGVYAYAVAWSALLSLAATAGMDQVVVRFVAVYNETQNWPAIRGVLRFSRHMAVGLAMVIAAAGALGIYIFAAETLLRQTMLITLLSLPLIVVNRVRQSALQGLNHPVLAHSTDTVVVPCAIVALTAVAYVLLHGNVTAVHAALASVGGAAIAFGLSTALLARKLPHGMGGLVPEYRQREWLTMVPGLICAAVAYHGVSRGEVLMLGLLRPSAEVGIYTVASRGAELMLFMYDAVTIVGTSLFAALYAKGDMGELQRFTTLATRSILYVSLPVLLLSLIAAPWFLTLFGQEFSQGAIVMRILSTTFFLSSLSGFIIVMLYMTGHQTVVAVTMGTMAIVNLALSALLIPRWGMTGAAVASGSTLVFLHAILVVVLYRRVGILSLPVTPRPLAFLSRRYEQS